MASVASQKEDASEAPAPFPGRREHGYVICKLSKCLHILGALAL